MEVENLIKVGTYNENGNIIVKIEFKDLSYEEKYLNINFHVPFEVTLRQYEILAIASGLDGDISYSRYFECLENRLDSTIIHLGHCDKYVLIPNEVFNGRTKIYFNVDEKDMPHIIGSGGANISSINRRYKKTFIAEKAV